MPTSALRSFCYHRDRLASRPGYRHTVVMTQQPQLDELAARMARAVPGLSSLRGEIEHNFRALLRSHFDRLDLVSRERFDTQAELLARTRSQLEALETRIRALEGNPPDSAGR